jgi:hypothetical protein
MTGRTGHLVLLAGLLAGCRIEDRTPTGSRRDQAEIQRLIYAYHRGAAPDPSGDPNPGALRVVRLDLRQEGDLAAAWVTARPTGTDDGDVLEHFVLRRSGSVWRVVNVGVASHATGQAATSP